MVLNKNSGKVEIKPMLASSLSGMWGVQGGVLGAIHVLCLCSIACMLVWFGLELNCTLTLPYIDFEVNISFAIQGKQLLF